MENFWGKKIIFIWQEKDIYVEMVFSGPILPSKKGLVDTTNEHVVHRQDGDADIVWRRLRNCHSYYQ